MTVNEPAAGTAGQGAMQAGAAIRPSINHTAGAPRRSAVHAPDSDNDLAAAMVLGAEIFPQRRGPARASAARLPLPGHIKLALGAFVDATSYADDLGASHWDFALEMPSLYRLRLTISDLRWLVGRGFLEHAVEVTRPGDAERSFRRPPRLMLCKKTCFILTPTGLDLARAELGAALAAPTPVEAATAAVRDESSRLELPRFASRALELPSRDDVVKEPAIRTVSQTRLRPMTASELIPRWDSDRQELRVGTIVVKRFRVPAESQETILAAFQEENWPARIDDPLPPRSDQSPKRRLQETIKSLNRNQKRHVIRFLGDGNGQGILWELRSDLTQRDGDSP